MSSELKVNGSDLIRLDRSRSGDGLACYIKSSIAIVAKTVFAATSKVFLFDIYLAKSKPILLGILYRPPDKLDFVKHQ